METHQSSSRESFRLPLPSLLQTKVSKAVLHRHTNANTLESLSLRCNTCLTKHHHRNDTSCRKTSFNWPLPSVRLNTRLFGTHPQPWEDSSQCYTCNHKTRYQRWTKSLSSCPLTLVRMYSTQRALFVPPLDLNPPIPVDTLTQSPRSGMARARESILG